MLGLVWQLFCTELNWKAVFSMLATLNLPTLAMTSSEAPCLNLNWTTCVIVICTTFSYEEQFNGSVWISRHLETFAQPYDKIAKYRFSWHPRSCKRTQCSNSRHHLLTHHLPTHHNNLFRFHHDPRHLFQQASTTNLPQTTLHHHSRPHQSKWYVATLSTRSIHNQGNTLANEIENDIDSRSRSPEPNTSGWSPKT